MNAPAGEGAAEPNLSHLVEQVKQGHTEVYAAIVEHYGRPLYQYAYSMLHSKEEAEDAVQDIFIRTYRSIGRYTEDISFTAWLYKIAYNHCLNVIRSRKRRERLAFLGRRSAMAAPDYDLKIRTEELLRELSLEEKQIILLRAAEEMSYEDIAVVLGCRAATVRKKFERARKKIAKLHSFEEEINDARPWQVYNGNGK